MYSQSSWRLEGLVALSGERMKKMTTVIESKEDTVEGFPHNCKAQMWRNFFSNRADSIA